MPTFAWVGWSRGPLALLIVAGVAALSWRQQPAAGQPPAQPSATQDAKKAEGAEDRDKKPPERDAPKRILPPIVPIDDVVRAIEQAKGKFTPPPDDRLQKAHEDLLAAMRQADALLKQQTPESEAGWRKFLRWTDAPTDLPGALKLHQETKVDRIRAAALATLKQIRHRFYEDEQGVEFPEFLAVREALTAYIRAHEVTPTEKELNARLDDLALRVRRYAGSPHWEDAAGIGDHLGWLHEAKLASDAVAATRARLNQPNLRFLVSAGFIGDASLDTVDETTPVHENIFGTSIRGTARLTGQVRLEPITSSDQGAFLLRLTGQIQSNNVGYNGPVTVRSQGTMAVNAWKRIFLDENGLREGEPAAAECHPSTQICGVYARHRLVARIGARRAAEAKGPAEQEGARRAEERIATRLDERTPERLAQANQKQGNKLEPRMVRTDTQPEGMFFSTDPAGLLVRALSAKPHQIGAITPPPKAKQPHDLVLLVHESMATNILEDLFSGRVITDKKVKRIRTREQGDKPADELLSSSPCRKRYGCLPADQNTEREFEFTLTEYPPPVTVQLDANEIVIQFRFRVAKGHDEETGRDFDIRPKVAGDFYSIEARLELAYDAESPARVGFKYQKGDDKNKVTHNVLDRTNAEIGVNNYKTMQPGVLLGPHMIRFTNTFNRELDKLARNLNCRLLCEGFALPGPIASMGRMEVRELSTSNGWLLMGADRQSR